MSHRHKHRPQEGDAETKETPTAEGTPEAAGTEAADVASLLPDSPTPPPAEQPSMHPTISINVSTTKPEVKKVMNVTPNPAATALTAARKAAETGAMGRTVLGQKVKMAAEAYAKRMSVPSNDLSENAARIKMLQDLLNLACPSTRLDMETATDVARVLFDHFRNHWGKTYDESTLLRQGRTLKGTAYDTDKLVTFFTVFTELAEGVTDKKIVTFDDARVNKFFKNPNLAIAVCRIRDNINNRNRGHK